MAGDSLLYVTLLSLLLCCGIALIVSIIAFGYIRKINGFIKKTEAVLTSYEDGTAFSDSQLEVMDKLLQEKLRQAGVVISNGEQSDDKEVIVKSDKVIIEGAEELDSDES